MVKLETVENKASNLDIEVVTITVEFKYNFEETRWSSVSCAKLRIKRTRFKH